MTNGRDSAPSGGRQEQESAQKPGAEEPAGIWHHLESEEVLSRLRSGENGLDEGEAEERLHKYGPNRLPEAKPRSAWIRFLTQFHNVLIYILMAAAVITALLDHWIDTWVILGVVVINALIGFIQEGKAEKALESIRKMLSLDARVIRNGRRMTIDAKELVPGDLVLLESGDKVPADMRLIRVRNLRLEESALTGESVATEKSTEPVAESAVPGDRSCMAFSGTSVVYGRGTGVVTATAVDTEIGKINRMITEVEQITTPLLRQIAGFGKALSAIILGLSALLFLIGYLFHDYTLDELFLAVISLAVAAIPEGLPAIMTITLAIGVQAMARRNAIIRRLPSVETLGSVSVICSDKTGTLTRNEMTVRNIVTAIRRYRVEGTGYRPEGEILPEDDKESAPSDTAYDRLIRTFYACNDAELSETAEGWQVNGDPTEGALVTLGQKAGLEDMRSERVDQLPFESEHQYMATLDETAEERVIYVKGAPERLLDMCTLQAGPEGEQEIDREYWTNEMERLAGRGYRLIAAACKPAGEDRESVDHADIQEGLLFLGIAGMIDPPRPEAIEAVHRCREAGIRVKMITGDHLITAMAIGREMGIGDGSSALSGAEIESMSNDELRHAAVEYDIFARTSPEHKLRLVTALQENGIACAMTGDGVNDAPALKRADVGIAMGIKGTEVTKEASEMVLADDNFASIANAVEEGRTIYDNLRKAILFILPTNGAESLVIMAAVLIGIVLPITPVQILWVNMVTAVTLALALSFEPTEAGVMKRPPRDTEAPIMGGYLIWRILFVSLLIGGFTLGTYYWLKQGGYEVDAARTVAVNTLVAGQLFYLFNCRCMHGPALGPGFLLNRVAFGAAGILILLQLFFTYAPFMNLWFGTASVAPAYWIYPLFGGTAIFLLVETEKYLLGRSRRRAVPVKSTGSS